VGPAYPRIPVIVYEYVPRDRQLLQHKYVPSVGTDNVPKKYIASYAAPLALSYQDGSEIRKELTKHIKAVIKMPRDIGESTKGDVSMLSFRIYEAVNKYRLTTRQYEKVCLTRDAHYTMPLTVDCRTRS
jgi:hypothetical protein